MVIIVQYIHNLKYNLVGTVESTAQRLAGSCGYKYKITHPPSTNLAWWHWRAAAGCGLPWRWWPRMSSSRAVPASESCRSVETNPARPNSRRGVEPTLLALSGLFVSSLAPRGPLGRFPGLPWATQGLPIWGPCILLPNPALLLVSTDRSLGRAPNTLRLVLVLLGLPSRSSQDLRSRT